MNQLKINRLPLLGTAMFLLLAAMWAGLLRMGWVLPPLQPTLAAAHGPLMVSGFLGTLIGLERAVGLGLKWTYAAPALTGLGGLILMLGLSSVAGAALITLGSVVLVAVFGYIIKHQPLMHSYAMGVAAVAWLIGNLLWLFGQPISVVAAWWAGYLILTIGGERLELSRLLLISQQAKQLFVACVALYLVGATLVPVNYAWGWRLTGAGMVALAAWLLQHDIARRTIKQTGLTRFIAVCMLSGYVWLGIGGTLAMWYGFLFSGPYDAVLHAVFLGFVFAMIFGHAPIIFPAVLGTPIPFSNAFYAHLGLLHASLLLRVVTDLMEYHPGRMWGAMLNVIALLLFLGNTIVAARQGRLQARRT
jgi:hypothetical protein